MTAQHDPAARRRPVGMVGTGNMGGRMTRRMVEAGHAVLAVDADPARIPACGASQANSLAELAERWRDSAWPSARVHSHLLAAMPPGVFPGVDQTDVLTFLERHSVG